MKKFLKRLLFFLFIPVAGYLFVLVVLNYLNNKAIADFKIDTNVTILFMGDSHIEKALDDKLIKGSLNIAQNSESFYFTYYKLQKILETNQHIKKIYLGCSYHSFSDYQYDFIFGRYANEIAARYFFILPFAQQVKVITHNISHFNVFTKNMLTMGARNVFTGNADFSFGGKFKNEFTNSSVKEKSLYKRLVIQYYNGAQLRDFSEINIQYLLKIKELCGTKNIQLILLQTPLHVVYRNSIPQKFSNKFKTFVAENNFELMDLAEMDLDDSCFIPDGDHVSAKGALILTNQNEW